MYLIFSDKNDISRNILFIIIEDESQPPLGYNRYLSTTIETNVFIEIKVLLKLRPKHSTSASQENQHHSFF